MTDHLTVYVSIGNSDDKLTQQRWSAFYGQAAAAVRAQAERIYGEWLSAPQSQWQNACVGFTVTPTAAAHLKDDLRALAAYFGQESIAWAEVGNEEMLEPRA
jgi:hypothetical protein